MGMFKNLFTRKVPAGTTIVSRRTGEKWAATKPETSISATARIPNAAG
jgi:hypothetical protein